MKLRHSSKDTKELGIVWYLIPALWVVAALAGYIALSFQATPVAALTPEGSAATNVFTLAPSSSSDPAVPDAATVFKDRPYEASEHVDTF